MKRKLSILLSLCMISSSIFPTIPVLADKVTVQDTGGLNTIKPIYAGAADAIHARNITVKNSKGEKVVIDGSGTAIGILDNGIANHPALRTEPKNPKFKGKGKVILTPLVGVLKSPNFPYRDEHSSNPDLDPFYPYMQTNGKYENTDVDNPKYNIHGLHVAGIAAANGPVDEESNQIIQGIAPEAQIVFAKAAETGYSSMLEDNFLAQDIKNLANAGADVVNMSLGTDSSTNSGSNTLHDAINEAVSNGVVVVSTVGNMGYMGESYHKPLAKNPDYGVIARPGLFNDVIGTVVFDSPYRFESSLSINNKRILFKNAFYDDRATLPISFNNKTGQIINMNIVTPDTVASTDVTGKWVLMYRNSISGFEKQSDSTEEEQYLPASVALKEKGAVGVIVANQGNAAFTPKLYPKKSADGSYIFDYFYDLNYFPVLSIGEDQISELKGLQNLNLKIIDVAEHIDNPDGMIPMDWSSWAVSSDRVFGIDMGAPAGFAVTSLGNGYKWNDEKNLYEPTWGTYDMAGTSMAAPQISGAVALVKQGLLVKHPELVKKSAETVSLIKNLLMSTSDPQMTVNNKQEKTYWSPRKQGNGIIQVDEAVHTDVIAISPKSEDTESGSAKTNLRDIKENKINFNIELVNYGSVPRIYLPKVTVMADEVDNEGYYTLKSENIIMPYDMEKVEVPAAKGGMPGKKEVTISATVPEEVMNKLKEKSPNGFHIDGYVRFYDETNYDNKVNLVHSFTGFVGDWDQAPTLEEYIYNMNNGDEPFYKDLMINPKEERRKGYLNSTHLESNLKTENGFMPLLLGAVDPKDYRTKTSKNHIAISPNGDGNADDINPILVMLRNFRKIDLEIANISKPNDKKLVYKTSYGLGNTDNGKSFFGSDNSLGKVLQSPKYLGWNGKDEDDRVIEGLYEHKIQVYPYLYDATNPLTQGDYNSHEKISEDHVVDFKVDITPPVLKSVEKIGEKNGIVSLKINANDPNLSQTDVSGSGIREVFISSHGKKIKVPFDIENENSLKDSVIQLDSNLLDNANITLIDWAYNSKTYPLEFSEDNDNIGELSIESVEMSIPETKEEVAQGEQELGPLTVEYEAVNAVTGHVYHNLKQLPAGHYHIRAVNLPEGYISKSENTDLMDDIIIKKGEKTQLKLKYNLTLGKYNVNFTAEESEKAADFIKQNGVKLSLYNPENNSIYYLNFDTKNKNFETKIPEGVYYFSFSNLEDHKIHVYSSYGQEVHAAKVVPGRFLSYTLHLDNEVVDSDDFDELQAQITSSYYEQQSYLMFTGRTDSQIQLEVTPVNDNTGELDESAKRTYSEDNGDFKVHETKSAIGDIESNFQLDLSDQLINALHPGDVINIVEVLKDGSRISSKNRAVVAMQQFLNAQMAYYAVEKALESVPEEQKAEQRKVLEEEANKVTQTYNTAQTGKQVFLYSPNEVNEKASDISGGAYDRKEILDKIWPGGSYPIVHIHNGHLFNVPFYENFHFRGDDNDYQGFLAYNTAVIYHWPSLNKAFEYFTREGRKNGTDHLPPTDELQAPDLTLNKENVWQIRPMRTLVDIDELLKWHGENVNVNPEEGLEKDKTATISQDVVANGSVILEVKEKDSIDLLKPLKEKIDLIKSTLDEKRSASSESSVQNVEKRIAQSERFLENPIYIERIINQEISDLDLAISTLQPKNSENTPVIPVNEKNNDYINASNGKNIEAKNKKSKKYKISQEFSKDNEDNNLSVSKSITRSYEYSGSYVSGYPDGTFRPDNNISRAEFATMIQNILGIKTELNNSSYIREHWAKDAINAVIAKNLMSGYPDGSFEPDRKITRAEMASVIFKVKHLELVPSSFKDMKGHWANEMIGALEKANIINGYPDETFRPDVTVTRAEAVTMLNKAFNITGKENYSFKDIKGHWAEKAISIAAK